MRLGVKCPRGARTYRSLVSWVCQSRIIGQHKLLLLPFYSFVQRYMTAYQQNVAQIMAYLAQACHELVPPNELVPVVKAIANNFVVDRVPPEAIQVGLNGLREVLSRTPLVLEEDGMGALIKVCRAARLPWCTARMCVCVRDVMLGVAGSWSAAIDVGNCRRTWSRTVNSGTRACLSQLVPS